MPKTSLHYQRLLRLIFLFTLITLPLDQWTKSLSYSQYIVHEDAVDTTIYQGKRQEIFSFGSDSQWLTCNLTYVRNHGASWGLMRQLPNGLRQIVLLGVGLGLSVLLLLVALHFLKNGEVVVGASLVAMVSGSFGNLLDRIRLGYVVDFISVKGQFMGSTWVLPSFNVADIVILTSLFCLITILPMKKNTQ